MLWRRATSGPSLRGLWFQRRYGSCRNRWKHPDWTWSNWWRKIWATGLSAMVSSDTAGRRCSVKGIRQRRQRPEGWFRKRTFWCQSPPDGRADNARDSDSGYWSCKVPRKGLTSDFWCGIYTEKSWKRVVSWWKVDAMRFCFLRLASYGAWNFVAKLWQYRHFFVDNFKKYFLNGKAGKSIRLSDSTEWNIHTLLHLS